MTDATLSGPTVEAVNLGALGAPGRLVDRCRQHRPASWLGRVFRSLCVSGVTTVLSLAILAVLIGFDLTTPAVANVISVLASIGPCFALNRRLVWNGSGRSRGNWRREVMPFWTYSLLSLIVSTVAVTKAGQWADSIGASPQQRTIIILAANILTYGTLWMGQFLLLDRVLFRHHHAAQVSALHATGALLGDQHPAQPDGRIQTPAGNDAPPDRRRLHRND